MPDQREIDQIAEFANSGVRAIPPPMPTPAPAKPARGSLPGIKGRRGLNEFLYRNWGNKGNAAYTWLGSALCMMISAGAAWAFDEPFLFPSLGATVFLMFETPLAEVSSTRNTVIGHYVGAAVAYFWLVVFSLTDEPLSAIVAGFTVERWAVIVLSLSFTGLFLRLLRAAHPPAGATTVIVGLGLLDTPHQMLILAIGVLIVAIPAQIFNRMFGVPAPIWASPYGGFGRRIRKIFGLDRPAGKPAPSGASGAFLRPLAAVFPPPDYVPLAQQPPAPAAGARPQVPQQAVAPRAAQPAPPAGQPRQPAPPAGQPRQPAPPTGQPRQPAPPAGQPRQPAPPAGPQRQPAPPAGPPRQPAPPPPGAQPQQPGVPAGGAQQPADGTQVRPTVPPADATQAGRSIPQPDRPTSPAHQQRPNDPPGQS